MDGIIVELGGLFPVQVHGRLGNRRSTHRGYVSAPHPAGSPTPRQLSFEAAPLPRSFASAVAWSDLKELRGLAVDSSMDHF
jgi:hypothetical protein